MLTSKQRSHLRGLAHSLKPVLRIGKDGVTPAVVEAVVDAFNTRELLKVKVLDNALLDARDVAGELSEQIDGTEVVQTMGSIATLYRAHPDKPKIELPR